MNSCISSSAIKLWFERHGSVGKAVFPAILAISFLFDFEGIFNCWNTWLHSSWSVTEERIWHGMWLVSYISFQFSFSHMVATGIYHLFSIWFMHEPMRHICSTFLTVHCLSSFPVTTLNVGANQLLKVLFTFYCIDRFLCEVLIP